MMMRKISLSKMEHNHTYINDHLLYTLGYYHLPKFFGSAAMVSAWVTMLSVVSAIVVVLRLNNSLHCTLTASSLCSSADLQEVELQRLGAEKYSEKFVLRIINTEAHIPFGQPPLACPLCGSDQFEDHERTTALLMPRFESGFDFLMGLWVYASRFLSYEETNELDPVSW
jgi:hypothetical protein